jgi:predicted SAM-dependent methyltransferase
MADAGRDTAELDRDLMTMEKMPFMIGERLLRGEFEFQMPLHKEAFYRLERTIGNLFFRRRPPAGFSPRLLNLGCGSEIYDSWINADEYAFKRTIREKAFRPDWRLDITRPWKCEDDYWDGIFTQHVLEHVPYSAAAFVLSECFRTLKPGAWLRVSVPSIGKYIDYYEKRNADPFFAGFPQRALAISFLTQMHLHKSAWDGELLVALLCDIGFESAREVEFGQGTDLRLVKDQDIKAPESLYVEARKPDS